MNICTDCQKCEVVFFLHFELHHKCPSSWLQCNGVILGAELHVYEMDDSPEWHLGGPEVNWRRLWAAAFCYIFDFVYFTKCSLILTLMWKHLAFIHSIRTLILWQKEWNSLSAAQDTFKMSVNRGEVTGVAGLQCTTLVMQWRSDISFPFSSYLVCILRGLV